MISVIKKYYLGIILCIAVLIIINAVVFNTIINPKENEICYLFVTGDIDNAYFENLAKTNEKVKKVVIYECFEDDINYTNYLQTSGLINSDLLIVTSEILTLNGAENSFVEILGLSDTFDYYKIDEKNYGICVNELLKDHLNIRDEDTDYYLVIKNNDKKDTSFAILKKLIGE